VNKSFNVNKKINRLKSAISICVPSNQRQFDNWGDKYYALSFQKALRSHSINTDILYMDEWQKATNYDILINIRGLKAFSPPKHIPIKILWQINHPELNTIEELSSYDKLFIASEYYTEILQKNRITAEFLPQAGDEHNFSEQKTNKEFDVLFVGNNHNAQSGAKRKIVEDLFKKTIDFNLKIVGASWHNIIPEQYILSDFVEWKDLPNLYSSAKIVLNDHQDTMAKFGFINNRCFDLSLMKQFQISDYVPGIEKYNIITYQEPLDLHNKIKYYLQNEDERHRQAKITYLLAKEETFANRAVTIFNYIKGILG